MNVIFEEYDQEYLDKSWEWLNDPEIKKLTLTPDFTRESQAAFFELLPNKADYKVWGVNIHGTKAGVVGLKGISENDAEYFGYIGEKRFWGKGVGGEIIEFAIDKAKGLSLHSLFLRVWDENFRAIRLYERYGFERSDVENHIIWMRRYIK